MAGSKKGPWFVKGWERFDTETNYPECFLTDYNRQHPDGRVAKVLLEQAKGKYVLAGDVWQTHHDGSVSRLPDYVAEPESHPLYGAAPGYWRVDNHYNEKQEELKEAHSNYEQVAHPKHYCSHPSGVECIQVTEWMNFNLGNAIKYIWRASLKGKELQDLKKAVWYIQREIERVNGGRS